MNKKGVSLIVLVVTVVILGVLVRVTLTQGVRSVNVSKLNLLEADLSQIQEYVLTNTTSNEEVQTFALKETLNKTQMFERVGEKNKSFLEEEFVKNNETEESLFTQLDTESIGKNNLANGSGKQGPNDFYYISNVTNKVYYLQGLELEGKVHYSLVNRTVQGKEKEDKKVNSNFIRTSSLVGEEENKTENKIPLQKIKPKFRIVDKGSFNLLYVIPTEDSNYKDVYLLDMIREENNSQNLTSKRIVSCLKVPKDVLKIKLKIEYSQNNFETVELDNISE